MYFLMTYPACHRGLVGPLLPITDTGEQYYNIPDVFHSLALRAPDTDYAKQVSSNNLNSAYALRITSVIIERRRF